LQHQFADVGQVFQGRLESPVFQPLLGLRIALLRALSKGEEGLGTAKRRSCIGDVQYLLRSHV